MTNKLKEYAKKITDNPLDDLNSKIDELVYQSKRDAWISGCEWVMKMIKSGKSESCEKAFEDYVNGK